MTRRSRTARRTLLVVATVASTLAVPAVAAPPQLGQPAGGQATAPPRVLVWGGAYGFRHTSITTGEQTFLQLAQETGKFTATVTENPADLSMATLRNYDVLAWISTTGKPPLTQQQRDEVIRWSACGGGNIGFHAVLDSDYGWAEHAELFGAQFDSHPHTAGSGEARVLIEDPDHPITAGWDGAKSFMLDDEYYRWRTAKTLPGISLPRNAPGTHVLLSLDETTVGNGIQKGPLPYEHHQPIAWTKTFRDGGRVYYNNMGHSESTWATAPFQTSIVNGVRWVGKVRPDAGCLDGTGDVSTRLSPPAPRRADVGHRCALPDIEPRNGSTWETHDAVSRLTEKGGSADLAAGVAGGLAWGAQYWVLDLHRSGSRQAKVTVRLTWPSPTDDYDLSVTTGWGVYGSHEAVGTTTERLALRHVPQCALLQMNGENMDAASGQAPTVTAKVTPKVSRSAQPAPTSRSLPT